MHIDRNKFGVMGDSAMTSKVSKALGATNKGINLALKSAIFYTIATVVGQGVVLISTRLFTTVMTVEEWGIVQTYGAWVLLLSSPIGMNLQISIRNAYTDYPDKVSAFSSSTLFCSTLFFGGFLIIGVGGAILLRQNLLLVLLALVQAFALYVVNFHSIKLSMGYHYKLRSILLCGPNVLHTLLSAVLILFLPQMPSSIGKILGNTIGIAIFAIFSYSVILYQGHHLINIDYWKYSLAISVPAIAYSLSNLVLMHCDRIMITAFVGSAETAIYSNAYNIGSILYVLLTATGQAWMPWLFMVLDKGQQGKAQPVAIANILFFSVAAICLLLVSPEILKLLTPQQYWGGIDYLPPIVYASFMIFLYSMPTSVEFYLKKTKIIARNTLIAAFVNILLNALFIPLFGAIAAAYTTVFCYILLFFLQWYSAKRQMPNIFHGRPFLIAAAIVGLFCVLFYCIKYSIWIRYGLCLALVALVVTVFIKNKDKILMQFRASNENIDS